MDANPVQKTTLIIAQTAKERGLENAHQLHLHTGISLPRSVKMWKGDCSLSANDIDVLCFHLSCSITDIFKREPETF